MDNTIIISIITSVCTLAGVIITCLISNNKTLYRIEQLEKKQDKYNSVIERTYKLEQKVEDLERMVK